MRAAVANLSKAVQLLDQAAVDVNRLDQAIKESNSAEAKGVLKEYIPRLGQLTKCLAQLPRGQVDDGLVSAVVNRLGAQRSELEGIRQTLPASGIRAVNRAASQLEAMSRMMWDIGPLEKL